eukprot:CAMPEP_0197678880 /NCGR_PEP_ID=MMETSP1338-20131121/90764_1 /TAXON_ID=43686 ORGANISM="Pelagodinium beii, Strain RCC1491" /NCGR_SAMPLE_ID=MMETSP1338 /ASSEMBLY_ACC=CAM_ASM_000754 /LENGTH=137 /DNA_ID=CAMNT_0043259867 /DNA_START=36 /DNA_END=446 /DNA_ORIENTATION=-
MPHCHSISALAARRQRALERGFLRQRVAGFKYVAVAENMAMKVKQVAASLEVHGNHCKLAGRDIHTASVAALTVKKHIGQEGFQDALRTHKIANRAKHSWADFVDEEQDNVTAESGEGTMCAPSMAKEVDPLALHDP